MATFKDVILAALDRGHAKAASINKNLIEVAASTKKRSAYIKVAVTDDVVLGLIANKSVAFIVSADGDVMNAIAAEIDKQGTRQDTQVDVKHMREKIWRMALVLTAEIEYAKRYEKAQLMGKYEALKEVWELLGGDKEQGPRSDD